jgi:chemotaxis protein histidine kinase CheA
VSTTGDVTIRITGDSSELVTAAKKAQGALDSTAGAASRAGAASDKADGGVKKLGDTAGKTGQASAKLAGALALVSPAAADAARDVADLADVGEVGAEAMQAMGLSMASAGPIALALAAAVAIAAAGYKVYTNELEDAKVAQDAISASSKTLAEWMNKDAEATTALLKGTGQLTEGMEKAQAAMKIEKEFRKTEEEQLRRILQLKWDGSDAEAALLEADLKVAKANKDHAIEQTESLIEYEHAKKASDEALAKRAERQAATAAKEIENARAAKAAADEVAAANREIAESITASAQAWNEKEEAAADALAADMEANEARKQAAEELAQAQIEASQRAKDQTVSDARAIAQAVIGFGQAILDATTKQHDLTTEKGRQAAEKQFRLQKAIKLAMAVVAGALAVQEALASAAPPVNFVLAGLVGATAAVEIGVIAAAQPKFHAGGLMPDEVRMGGMTTLEGEGAAIISKQGMRAANAGKSSAPAGTTVNLKLRHQTIDRVTSETIARGGQTQRAVAKLSGSNVPFGHRKDTWRR